MSLLNRALFIAIAFFNLSDLKAEDQNTNSQSKNSQVPLEVIVESERVAVEDTASSYAMPVTVLRYEPYVDLQSRGSAEAQSDVSIRGGTFENTSFRVGGASFVDPQTGHYVAELPFSPRMLTNPKILTDLDNSLYGFNASVGTVSYDLRPIQETGAALSFGGGDYRSHVEDVYVSAAKALGNAGTIIASDLNYSHSGSIGSRPDTDSDFSRVSGRFQIQTESTQTDILAGYQEKFFSWPYLYAPEALHTLIGSTAPETDSLRTTVVMLNHQYNYAEDSFVRFSPYLREIDDDYELDRSKPGLFNPYRHTTHLRSFGADGVHSEKECGLAWSLQYAEDDIDSTALTFGKYQSRSLFHGTLVPQYTLSLETNSLLRFQAGAAFNDTNRDAAHFGPVARINYEQTSIQGEKFDLYTGVSQSSQVPGYTALNSNPQAGLFRGNADLAQTVSTSYDLGGSQELLLGEQRLKFQAATFYRYDKNLVDWTYQSTSAPSAARVAENVDIHNTGVEMFSTYSRKQFRGSLGYTFLYKDADYDTTSVDASFYALNFPRHRITVGLSWEPLQEISLRSDNELRWQEPNSLRSSSDKSYFLSSAAVTWSPAFINGFQLKAIVDNLTNESFEEVPGVPSARRAAMFVGSYVW